MSLRRTGIAMLAAGLATAVVTLPVGTVAKAQPSDRSADQSAGAAAGSPQRRKPG